MTAEPIREVQEELAEWQRMLVLHEQHRRESNIMVANLALQVNDLAARVKELEKLQDAEVQGPTHR
jgi:hypothetical protein